jgi:DNA-binding response OmpR family regulator
MQSNISVKLIETESSPLHVIFTDDDLDDCFFFQEAINEIPLKINLVILNDGIALMHHLKTINYVPHVLFIDVNMPRKNGFECIKEIRQIEAMKNLVIIVYSTSYDKTVANILKMNGADFYIRKPAEFHQLKKIIHYSLLLIHEKDNNQKKQYLLSTDSMESYPEHSY